MQSKTRNIYSISKINSYIKNMFAQDYMLGLVYVRGEISNLKYHSSGHIYFTLKDEKSTLACVMFAGYRKNGLLFQMQEGQQVVVQGSIEVYERDGRYQLYAKEISREGQGDLSEAFEALKKRLDEMGMFAPEYKQPIPYYSKVVGVVTAPTGAAVQDIINISLRRNPYVQIVLYPAIVQGDAAPESIVRGIRALEAYGVDVMIVGRGGGSMEDLWGFNSEAVAQAIFDCKVPIISAVGHEVDFTIADFVADLRAPTPSAAAELAVLKMEDLLGRIAYFRERLDLLWDTKMNYYKVYLEKLQLKLAHLSPENEVNQHRTHLIQLEEMLEQKMDAKMEERKHRLELLITRLQGCSPLVKLSQGYSHVSDFQGKTITDVAQVQVGQLVNIFVSNGRITAKVEEKESLELKMQS